MARRKAAKKPSKHAARKLVHAPKFPADHLPAELIHMVYTYLEPTEAAAFRWAGRVVAEIGLQYLVPTVYLRLNEESYDRLLAISEYPVVSKYVVNLDYETRGLSAVNRKEFDLRIIKKMIRAQRHESSKTPNRFASARACRAYKRESVHNAPILSQRQITQLLDRAWLVYEASYSSQKKVEVANFFRKKIVKAMKQLRNLKRISTSPDSAYKREVAEIKDIFPTCYIPPKFSSFLDPTSPILLAAASAGLHVENLCCQPFSFQIFTHDKQDLAALKRSMLHLKTMYIDFTSRSYLVPEIQIMQRECLATRQVLNLITSAPDLEYLGLKFDWWLPWMCRTIDATIGKFYWSSLKAVSLEGLSSDENDLVDFCERHTRTLKDLSLKHMNLSNSSWDVTFHRIRQAFRLGQQLDSCKLCGIFFGPGGQKLYLDPRGEEGDNAGRIISNYIRATNVGDISVGEYYEAMGLK